MAESPQDNSATTPVTTPSVAEPEKQPSPPSKPPEKDQQTSWAEFIGPLAFTAIMLGTVGYGALKSALSETAGPQLVAATQPARPSSLVESNPAPDGRAQPRQDGPELWTISGRILNKGAPVGNALIWAVASDHFGNRVSPPSQNSRSDGGFSLGDIPAASGAGARFDEIRVHAYKEIDAKEKLETSSLISASRERVLRELQPNVWLASMVLLIFALGVLFGFSASVSRRHGAGWARGLYFCGIATALGLSLAMGLFVASFLRAVIREAQEGDIVPLGYASVFKGTYVRDIPAEWLLSLTSWQPPTKANGPNDGAVQAANANESLSRGFGAPLWVVFLAVVGSALYTIALVVNEIRHPPSFEDFESSDQARFVAALVDFRQRVQNIVQHQFFMLFAPLGGVFIFQLLVAAGAASNPVTIAVAAIGAGATLNLLLASAVSASARLLQPPSVDARKPDQKQGVK